MKETNDPFSDYDTVIQLSVYSMLLICILISFLCIGCCVLHNNDYSHLSGNNEPSGTLAANHLSENEESTIL